MMEEQHQQARYHPSAGQPHRSSNWTTQQQQQKQLLQRYSSTPPPHPTLSSSSSGGQSNNPPSLDHTSNSSTAESWSTGSGRIMKSSSFSGGISGIMSGSKGHAVVVPPPTSYPSYYFPKEEEQGGATTTAASPRSAPYQSPRQQQQTRVARSPREAYYNQKRAASLERGSHQPQQHQFYSPQQPEQSKSASFTSATPVSPVSPGRSRLQERARQLHHLTALSASSPSTAKSRASSSSLSYPDDEQDGFGAVTVRSSPTAATSTGTSRKSPSWQQYTSAQPVLDTKEDYARTTTITSTTPVKQATTSPYYHHPEDNPPLSPPRDRAGPDAPSPGRVRELREHFFNKQGTTSSRQESPSSRSLLSRRSFDMPHSPAIIHLSSTTSVARPSSTSLQERYQPQQQQRQRQQYPAPPLEDLLYGGARRSLSPSRSSDITNSDTARSSGGGTFNNKYYQAALMARMRVPTAGPVPTEVVSSPRSSSSHTRTDTFSGVGGVGVRASSIPPPSPRMANTLDDSADASGGSGGVFSSVGPVVADRDMMSSVLNRHSRSESDGAAVAVVSSNPYNPTTTNRGRSRKPPPTASTNSRYYAAAPVAAPEQPSPTTPTPLDTAYAAQRGTPRRPNSREPSPMVRERMRQFSGEDHDMSQQRPEPKRSLSHDSSSLQRLQRQNSMGETSIERLAREFTGDNTERPPSNPHPMQALQSENDNVPSYTESTSQNRYMGHADNNTGYGNDSSDLPESQTLTSPLSSPREQSHFHKSSSPSNVASYWLQKEQGGAEMIARESPSRNFQYQGNSKRRTKSTPPPPVLARNGLSGKDQSSLPFWARDSPDRNSTPSEVPRAQSDVEQLPSWAVESPLRPTFDHSSFPRQARSDTVTSAENQDVASLVARLTAVSRDNPSMALAQIDSILKKESRSSSVSPEQQVEDARQEPVEVEDDLESDDETSVSSITNPSYQTEKPFKDQIKVTTRQAGSSPELIQMSQKSLSSNRRPRPSALHHYQSATTAAGAETATRPMPQTKKTSRLKERLLQLEKCPPPSSINVKENDREPSPFHDSIPDETRKMVPHIASDSHLIAPQPQRKLDKYITDKDLLAKKIKTWDEMSRSHNNTPESHPREVDGNANTILPKLLTSPKSSSRPHPWDGEEPDSNSIVQEQPQTNAKKGPDGFFRGSTQTHHNGLISSGRISREGTNPFDEGSNQGPSETCQIRSSEQQRKKEQIASAFDDAWVAMPSADSPLPMKPDPSYIEETNASSGESYPAARSRSQPPARRSSNRRDPVPVDLDESFEGSSNALPNAGDQLPSPGEASVSNFSYEQGAIEVALLDESFEASSSFGMPPKSPANSTKSSGKRRGFLKAFMRRAEKKKSFGGSAPGTSHASISQSSAGIKSLPNQRRPEPQLRMMAPPPGFVPNKSLLDDPPRRGRGLGRDRSRSQSTERFRSKSMAQKFGRVMRLYDHE